MGLCIGVVREDTTGPGVELQSCFCFSRSLSHRMRIPTRQKHSLECSMTCSGGISWAECDLVSGRMGHFALHSDTCLAFTGESIPIRLFLAGYELTPTMRDINKKFSVRYYLNLVLIDEEERRYFKQQVRPGYLPKTPGGPRATLGMASFL